jgi:ABC-2 type transport system ATP-binding protein
MICDRVGVVVKGKLLASGRVDELVSGNTRSVEIVCEGLSPDQVALVEVGATRVLTRGRQCLIALPGPDRLEEVLAGIRRHGGRLVSVTPQKGSLEELFLSQAGKKIDE